jgi:hypothetical protein
VLHGNVFDHTPYGTGAQLRYGSLSGFLAEQVFGSWDLVLHYDLASGLRVLAGADQERLKAMVALANRKFGDITEVPRDPTKTLFFIDRMVQRNLMAKEGDRLSVAVLFDHASYCSTSTTSTSFTTGSWSSPPSASASACGTASIRA